MRYIRNRMIEFRDRMAPLLKELNLRACTQKNDAGIEVYFVVRDKKADPFLSHSSVSLVFEDREETNLKEAAWDRAYLRIEQHAPRPVGDTGWFHHRFWGAVFLDLPDDPETMWAFIEQNFQEQPFITTERDPTEIQSEHLVDAFNKLDGLPEYSRIEGLGIDRQLTEKGFVESIVFEDSQGREVRLRFSGDSGKGEAHVDGEKVVEFNTHFEDDILRMALALRDCNYDSRFLRK